MALVGLAVWDTAENGRSKFTYRTIKSLVNTVNWNDHRIFVVDNASCEDTKVNLANFKKHFDRLFGPDTFEVVTLPDNVGTARAINQAWQHRKSGENCLKMDNDVEFHECGWLDKLEECISREPKIGIIGCKRTDLAEWPSCQIGQKFEEHIEYKSKLLALPHKYRSDESWLVIERVSHCFGTVQLYSSALLDAIGYLYQMGIKYSFDDSLSAIRCHVAGFWSAFYPHYKITHIDLGGDEPTRDKERIAGEAMNKFHQVKADYLSGVRSIKHGMFDE